MLHKCASRIVCNRNASVPFCLFADASNAALCSARTGSSYGSDPTQTAGSTDMSSDDRISSPFVQNANGYKIGCTLDPDLASDIGRIT